MEQVNIRFPKQLLDAAKKQAKAKGYGTLQEFVRDTVRERVHEEFTRKEMDLIVKLARKIESRKLYGTEEELFKKLNQNRA